MARTGPRSFAPSPPKAPGRKKLHSLANTYQQNRRIVEKQRQISKFRDASRSYLVWIKGAISRVHCTLPLAELVADMTSQGRAERIRSNNCPPASKLAPRLALVGEANSLQAPG